MVVFSARISADLSLKNSWFQILILAGKSDFQLIIFANQQVTCPKPPINIDVFKEITKYLKVWLWLCRAFSHDLLCVLGSKNLENNFLAFIMFHVISRTFLWEITRKYISHLSHLLLMDPKRKSRKINRKSHSIEKNHEIRNCPHPIWQLFYILSFSLTFLVQEILSVSQKPTAQRKNWIIDEMILRQNKDDFVFIVKL